MVSTACRTHRPAMTSEPIARDYSQALSSLLGSGPRPLRDLDVSFGPGVTAVVGVSGSGKSSLAFDVVYTEARRRFMVPIGVRTSSGVINTVVRT